MDNTDFAKEALTEAVKNSTTLRTMADVVGMPDSQDKEFIQRLILNYDRAHPGQIKNVRDWAKEHTEGDGKFNITNKQASGRLIFELPEELHRQIEIHYPTLFSDKKHFRWFCLHFKELMIPERY